MKFNTKSLYLISLISTSLIMSGCDLNKHETLVDDFGEKYNLYQNKDGTETIRYWRNQDPENEDNDYYKDTSIVTIKRNEDNSIDYISGNEGLILGLATGYLLFHGIDSKVQYDRGKYVPTNPVILNPSVRNQKLSNYRPSTTTIVPTPRSGFGSTGVRSSVS